MTLPLFDDFYGRLLLVRPPSPVIFNKAGANYKSEITHHTYFPRKAYDEWLALCDGILACGGDAIFAFEEVDTVAFDHARLSVDSDGNVFGSQEKALGHVQEIQTGRVFTANGPWVIHEPGCLRVLLPNMLSHRVKELSYYERILEQIAEALACELDVQLCPDRWEGLADVMVLRHEVVFTYTVSGNYDRSCKEPKTLRSSREGVEAAARFAGIPEEACVFQELEYPHFHGDTVHFCMRDSRGCGVVRYQDGLLDPSGPLDVAFDIAITQEDAVSAYAANSRQVAQGVLVPEGVTPSFMREMEAGGLKSKSLSLTELFGKAGGGPGCATLFLPAAVELPQGHPLLFSSRRDEAYARRERVPEKLEIAAGYFEGKHRG